MTTENTTSIADKVKLGLALILVGAGIWAYYWLADTALVLRLLAVVAGLLAGAAVAWLSAPGKQFLTFALESWAEVKKVVWPTARKRYRRPRRCSRSCS
jgi:preprotein translocase subunit SecE